MKIKYRYIFIVFASLILAGVSFLSPEYAESVAKALLLMFEVAF